MTNSFVKQLSKSFFGKKEKKNEHFDSFVSELSRDKHLVNLTSNSQICVGWVAAAGGLEAVALIFLLATKHCKLLEKARKPKQKQLPTQFRHSM